MVIRKVNNNTFDVFMADEFWGDWTRVRLGGVVGVYSVAGRRLNVRLLTQVAEVINGVK